MLELCITSIISIIIGIITIIGIIYKTKNEEMEPEFAVVCILLVLGLSIFLPIVYIIELLPLLM